MEKYQIRMPVKEGEFFATIIGQYERSSNQLVNLEINENNRKLTTCTVGIKEDYITELASAREGSGILFIFKYLGDNKAIEILTKREVIMSEENLSKLTDANIFENSEEYKRIADNLTILAINHHDYIYKLDNNIKLEYAELIREYAQELTEKLTTKFVENDKEFKEKYQNIITSDIYDIASVDNMLFNFNKEMETKVKDKVKVKVKNKL